jgi:ElaB/YqjD/DUF883 family membrane-anchored ribosome-binding protein
MSLPLKDRFQDVKDQTVQNLVDARDRLKHVSKQAVKNVDHHVRRDPWKFIGGAALFSVVFGFFLGRKSKRK